MIFVDTSAWLAAADVRDGYHGAALRAQHELYSGQFGRLITSDYILDETLTLLRRRIGPEGVRKFAAGLAASRSVQLVPIAPGHFLAARDLFLDQGETSWSFTDCSSFVLMRELGISVAFTFDRGFREAGFEVRPAPAR